MALSEDLIMGGRGAAKFTGLPERTIYHLVETARIPAIKMGRQLFFRKSDLERAFAGCSARMDAAA